MLANTLPATPFADDSIVKKKRTSRTETGDNGQMSLFKHQVLIWMKSPSSDYPVTNSTKVSPPDLMIQKEVVAKPKKKETLLSELNDEQKDRLVITFNRRC